MLRTKTNVKSLPVRGDGFSLLELVVVLAGLGILASLAIPNFIKYLQFAQIDEAKSLLNTAASECLQELRRSSDNGWQNVEPEALKSRKSSTPGGRPALPGNYQYKDGKNTCKEVQIHDPSGGGTIFPMLRFRIDSAGKVFKDSQYFNDESRKDCESWGNCGGSESADYLISCKENQTRCDTNYSNFVKTQPDGGPKEIGKWQGTCKWPKDPEPTCQATRIWIFEGNAYNTQSEYDAKFTERFGKQCSDAKNAAKTSFSSSGTGIVDLPNCSLYERYYKGVQLACNNENDCNIAYLAASERDREDACLAAENTWKASKVDGMFSETGCTAKWQCNKPTHQIFSTKADYDASDCGTPPKKCTPPPSPLPPVCSFKPELPICNEKCN